MWGVRVRGAFPPAAAMVVTVFCSLPEHEPLFPVNQGIVGIARTLCTLSLSVPQYISLGVDWPKGPKYVQYSNYNTI